MPFTNPSVSDFQTQFSRDFPYGTDPNTSVLDADINSAFNLANVNINQGLFANQETYNLGYLYLSAHYLVLNLRSSSQGINGQFAWLEQSKGVGNVNQAFSIPQRILDNPYWAWFTKTNYGSMYLELLMPQFSGYMYSVYGGTNP